MDNQNPTVTAVAEPQDFVSQLKSLTVEEGDERLRIEPDLQGKMLALEPKVIDEVYESMKQNSLTRATSPRPAPAPTQAPIAAQPPADGEEEVTLKIKRTDLGDYAPAGRSISDAIIEMAKGYRIKDKLIAHLKGERLPELERVVGEATSRSKTLEEELQKLRDEAAKKPAEPLKPAEETITVPDLPADLDFFNEAHQKVLIEGYRAMQKIIAGKKEVPPEPPKSSPAPAPAAAPQAPAVDVNRAVQDEFNEIRTLQVNPRIGHLISTHTDIETLNAQYSQFTEGLAELCGINRNSIYTPNGNITKQVSELVTGYFNQNDSNGQRIREAAEKANIRPPAEMDTLRRIYIIRQCSIDKRGGKEVRYPLEVAVDIAKSRYPEVFAEKGSQKLEDRQRLEAVIDQRKAKAIEVPTAQGAEPMDDNTIGAQAIKLMNEKNFDEMSDGEREIIKAALRKDGQSENAINNIIYGDHKPKKP
jgi:hypothetical protein